VFPGEFAGFRYFDCFGVFVILVFCTYFEFLWASVFVLRVLGCLGLV